jgi:uncharacterized membrane protein
MTEQDMKKESNSPGSDSPDLKIISPPQKTVEMLYNRMAIIYFGLLFIFLGYFMVNNQPSSYVNIIGLILSIIAFFLYYFLLIDFVAHYFIKIFGIIYLNYQQNRNLWYFFGIVLICIIVFGVMINVIPPTSMYYGPSWVILTLSCGFIVELSKPLYIPSLNKFYEKYLKNFSDKHLKDSKSN